MRKLGRITAVLFLLATLFSCNLGSAYKDVNDNPSKKPDVNGTDNTAELVVVKIPAVNLGRTAFTPDTSVYEDYSFVLSGYYDGAETLRVIKEWNNYDSMIGSEFVIKKGSWRFVLTANKVDYIDDDFENPYIIPVLLGESKEAMTIEEPTELAFSLSQIKDCELDGFYNFTLDFPKSDYWTVNASVLDAKTSQVLDYNPTVVMSKEGDSVNIYGALPGGNYKINVKFVYHSPTLDFASPSKYPVFVVVAPDCMTSGHDRVSYGQLNMQIPINYVGLDEYNLPATYPASFSPKEEDSVALPLPTRDGYDFKGWFTTWDNTPDSKITKTPVVKDDSDEEVLQELVIYPRWVKTSSDQFSLILEDGTEEDGITLVVSEETDAAIRKSKNGLETGFYVQLRNTKTGYIFGTWMYYKEFVSYGNKYNYPFVEPGTEYEYWVEIDGVKTDVLAVTPTTGLGESYIFREDPEFSIGDDGILHADGMPLLEPDSELGIYEKNVYVFQIWKDWDNFVDEIDLNTIPSENITLDLNDILKKGKLYGKDFILNPYCWIYYKDVKYAISFNNLTLNCGSEVQNYLTDIEVPVTDTQVSHISVNATDRGVKFETTVLKGTAITFTVTEKASGIQMVRDWVKESDWNKCALVYPFVEAGKDYDFNLIVSQSDHTLYEKDFTITATAGLGEFKIENTEDYDVELTNDKVVHFTAKPEFTLNSNVRIAKQGVFYELYEADNGDWDWIYNQESWFDSTNGTLSLLDKSDGKDKWKSPEEITARMSGHQYRAIGQTYVVISGYTDNGQTYFKMNDKKESVGSWGGSPTKVYVLFGDFHEEDVPAISDLPGEPVTLTLTNKEGRDYEWNCNYMVVDYDATIEEPISLPAFATGKSTFNYWENRKGDRINFPYNSAPKKWDGDYTISFNGEVVEYVDFIIPNITATYTATLMDGTTVIGTEKFNIKRNKDGLVKKVLTTKLDNTDGKLFAGWCTDKDCTKPFCTETYGDITVYAKWVDADLWWNGNQEMNDRDGLSVRFVSDDVPLDTLATGDTLYFEVYCNKDTNTKYDISINQYSPYLEQMDTLIYGGETKLFAYPVSFKKELGNDLLLTIDPTYHYEGEEREYYGHFLKNIYYSKGPRVNIKIYNGSELLKTYETIPNEKVSVDSITINNGIIEGIYTDSDLTKEWDGSAGSEDIDVYVKIKKTETLWTGYLNDGKLQIDSSKFEDLDVGDTLYFTVYNTLTRDNDNGYFTFRSYSTYDKSIYIESFGPHETKIIEYQFTENDSSIIEDIKSSGLYIGSIKNWYVTKVDYVSTKSKLDIEGIYFNSENDLLIRFYANSRKIFYNDQECKYLVDVEDPSIFTVLYEGETIATLKYTIIDEDTITLQEQNGDGNFVDNGTWDKKKVSVALMDGETKLSTVEVYVGTSVSAIKTPAKEGYVFVDWYSSIDYTVTVSEITDDMTDLYSKWVEIGDRPFSIIYKGDSGGNYQWSAGEFIVEDDWESIEIVFDPNTVFDDIQLVVVSDSVESEESWGTAYYQKYQEAKLCMSFNFADWLTKNDVENGEIIADSSLLAYGATKISKLNVQNKTIKGFSVKILSAVVTKTDNTTEAVIASPDWASSITED